MAKKLTADEILSLRKKHFLPTAVHYHKKPLYITKAKGEYVWDDEGKQYLDAIGGIVCISAGHNHPKIKAAIKEMLDSDEIQHSSTLYLNDRPVKLAAKLSEHTAKNLTRWHFTNSGSEANEAAFMAARQATGETMIINLRHSYHGGTAAALANCGHHTWRFRSQPVTNVTSAMEPYCYRCPFGASPNSCELECAKNVETTIQTSTHGKIAAFVAEPVMGVGGFITPQKDYFQMVAGIVRNYGGKYISDEVQTGSGRCGGSLFLSTELGIPADMITTAKSMGNGAAIGAVVMTDEIAETLAGKSFFNTFGSDPYQTEQARITIEIIEEEKLIQNAKEVGAYLQDGLKALMKHQKLIGDVRGRGLLLGVELVKDKATKEHASLECAELMDRCRDKGLLVGKGGLKGNVLRVAPPLTMTKAQADFMLKVIDSCLTEMTK
ncbi:MAG: aspartate aminotransferase family protein [Bdellovibrionales bacterium]|nr:aspartate aminotransferase family protein [Bdellovibrionales bacterium]